MKTVILALYMLMTGTDGNIMLSVDDAVKIALENNKEILIEKQSLEVSEGEILTQRGVFDPQLELSSSFTDSKSPTASTFIESGEVNSKSVEASSGIFGVMPTGTFYDVFRFKVINTKTNSALEVLSPNVTTELSFTVGQELLKGFGFSANLANVRVAKKASGMSQKELERVISDILVAVQSAYWNLVSAYRFLELAHTAHELAVDLERRNEIQVEVGVLPPVVLTQAKSEVAKRQFDLITAENFLKQSEDVLKNILSIDLSAKITAKDKPKTTIVELNDNEIIESALKRRPEIELAKLEVESRSILKKFFSNQRLPQLTIQASVAYQGLGGEENPDRLTFVDEPISEISDRFLSEGNAFSQLTDRDFPTWQILGTFSFPLFNTTARGDYRKANAEHNRSEIAYSRVLENIELDARNAIREVNTSAKSIEATNLTVNLFEEVLRNEEEKLKVGIGTTREVLEAQRDLVNARFEQIRAVSNYNIDLVVLERAKGTIMDTNGIEIVD